VKRDTNSANFVKIAQGIRPLRGIYIPHFDQISVKISVLGVLYPYRCTDGGEIWHGGGPLVLSSMWHGGGELRSPTPCQISPPSVQRVAPAGRKTSKPASE